MLRETANIAGADRQSLLDALAHALPVIYAHSLKQLFGRTVQRHKKLESLYPRRFLPKLRNACRAGSERVHCNCGNPFILRKGFYPFPEFRRRIRRRCNGETAVQPSGSDKRQTPGERAVTLETEKPRLRSQRCFCFQIRGRG